VRELAGRMNTDLDGSTLVSIRGVNRHHAVTGIS
jgi:hypothetical protein